MRIPIGPRERLYRSFRKGDGGSLVELLEGERDGLYDFLLRMTGQISRSYETCDEVFQSLTEETMEVLADYPALKVCLYTTARKFNADIWGAETNKLANAAAVSDLDQELDRKLRSLPSQSREALLLWTRAGFDASEVAEITGWSTTEVEEFAQRGLRQLFGGAKDASAEAALRALALHPLPPRSSQATVNLSMVMQGIKTKPAGLGSPHRVGLLLVVAGLLVTWFLSPQTLIHAANWALELLGMSPLKSPVP